MNVVQYVVEMLVAVSKQVYWKFLLQVQRWGAFRMSSIYRIAEDSSIIVNEALPFVALLAKERKTIYYAQKGEDSRKVVTREEREHTGVRKLNSNADGLCRSLGP